MPIPLAYLRAPAYTMTLLALVLTGCSEGGTSASDTDQSSSELTTSVPELGSAIPDPFQVVTEIPGEEEMGGSVDEPVGGESEPDPQTSSGSEGGESEPSVDPEAELPEFDENGVPYCD